jgi:hypothetical protein
MEEGTKDSHRPGERVGEDGVALADLGSIVNAYDRPRVHQHVQKERQSMRAEALHVACGPLAIGFYPSSGLDFQGRHTENHVKALVPEGFNDTISDGMTIDKHYGLLGGLRICD